MQCVVLVLAVRSVPCTHGMSGFLLICMDLLNDFTKQVVVSRRETGIRKWTWWLREDLGARPYAWLRPDFVPPSLFLVKKVLLLKLLGSLLSLVSLMLSSAKPGCLFSVGLVILSSLLTSYWHGTCKRLLWLKRPLLAVWMGGRGMRLRHCIYLGFLVWLFSWNWLRPLVSGLRVFWTLILP